MNTTPTVMFVDDNSNARESFKRILRNKPYRVLAVETAQQCVDVLAITDIQVLVTDLSMPGFNGATLINYFKEAKPNVVRIVLSGKLDPQSISELIGSGDAFRCLEKPCPAPTVVTAIKDALNLAKSKLSAASTPTSNREAGEGRTDSCDADNLTSLVHDAVKDVERLRRALEQHSEQERPLSERGANDKQ